PAAPAPSETADWLKSLDAADSTPQSAASADTPDWLQGLGSETSSTPAPSETADWLKSLDAADATPQDTVASAGTPDWLQGLGSETPAAPAPSETADWLKSLGATDATPQGTAAMPDALSEIDMPSWLSGESAPAASSAEPQKDSAAFGDDVPDWLKSAAPQSSIFDDLPPEQPVAPIESSETPDWLNAFKSVDSEPSAQPASPSAFGDDFSSSGNADALFTDMPDWLANSVETPAPTPASETPAENEIEAGQLPSWVQSMRPVDTGVSQIASTASDMTLESRGALAGLQGVLPAAPGYAPTSKPKAYSIKLQATDEQLSQAILLEQILAAETSPVPIASFSTLRASRGLRWSLAFLFFAMVFAALFLRTQIFSLPVGIPLEADGALQAARNIPVGAPVLVAFDYEPARAAEMETAAAPMFDQMVLLRNPRLTFIATNENSAILAERFMLTGPMAAHRQNGLQYLNLGYLPGGQLGIRAFAQNPRAATPFDVNAARAWDSAQLQGVDSFSSFAAFILVTDNANSARIWIEQTISVRGATPMIVISSAQSAPMIQPYYATGQIVGLVGGLQGGAILEQNNEGRPGTARVYWDAYSAGMWLAAILILFGGLWNLFMGSRDRAAAREAK
ncbi:MAG: hypothetical protein PHQ36_13705, partial [Anaerolineales bacterium]|nr:hypothetical protein [Anaerolineales bacterium]